MLGFGAAGARFAIGFTLAAGFVLPAAIGPGTDQGLRATLDGQTIPLVDVARYQCHDRDYPLIRCFRTTAELGADERGSQSTSPSLTTTSTISPTLIGAFVRWYADANYTGASFDAYYAYADLSTIGWNDQISSFTPLNGGHPVWWHDANYSGVKWDWGTSAVSYVGAGANDQFSSVQKL